VVLYEIYQENLRWWTIMFTYSTCCNSSKITGIFNYNLLSWLISSKI